MAPHSNTPVICRHIRNPLLADGARHSRTRCDSTPVGDAIERGHEAEDSPERPFGHIDGQKFQHSIAVTGGRVRAIRLKSFGRLLCGRWAGVASAFFAFTCNGLLLAMASFYVAFLSDAVNSHRLRAVTQYQPELATLAYDAGGRQIGRHGAVNRHFVPLEKIPQTVRNAFIAAEDRRFYRHAGIDYRATFRAILTNLHLYDGPGVIVGGSTITQQVIKNLLLTPRKTLHRKIQELAFAIQLERTTSKDRILEVYLNHIYLGRGAYGVGAAAPAYFDKPLDALSVAEAATLASLPKAPSRYDPAVHPDRVRHRRDRIIDRMLEYGYITYAQARIAKAAPLRVDPKRGPAIAPGTEYFVTEVYRRLADRYGTQAFETAGFRVSTTLRRPVQKLAIVALRKGLVDYDRRHGWHGLIGNISGRANWRTEWPELLSHVARPRGTGAWQLAVVLTVTPIDAEIGVADRHRGRIALNELNWARPQVTMRPNDGLYFKTAGKPVSRPGDVLKEGDIILVERLPTGAVAGNGKNSSSAGRGKAERQYGLRQIPEVRGAIVVIDPQSGRVLALSGGFSFWRDQFNAATQAWRQPGSAFKPFVYLAAMENGFNPATIVADEPLSITVSGTEIYRPTNFSRKYLGEITIRTALEHSRNIPTIRVAMHVGLKKIALLAERVKIADSVLAVPAMALGAVETTPLRLAAAYGALANGGKYIRPALIDEIRDRDGKLLFRHSVPACANCGHFRAGLAAGAPILGSVEPIADPRSIYQIISMLRGVVQQGTGYTVGQLGKPIAGKTGTTNDFRDAWFVGFTHRTVVAVWIGFDQGRSLGPGESGSIAAAPVVRDFFEIALKGRKGHEFEPPKGLVRVRIELPPKKNEATSGEGDDDVGLDGEEQPLRVVYEYLKVNPTTPNAVVVVMRGSQVEVVGGERGDDAGSGNSIKQDAVAGITKERMRQRAQRNRPSQRNRHPTWVDRPDSSYRNY